MSYRYREKGTELKGTSSGGLPRRYFSLGPRSKTMVEETSTSRQHASGWDEESPGLHRRYGSARYHRPITMDLISSQSSSNTTGSSAAGTGISHGSSFTTSRMSPLESTSSYSPYSSQTQTTTATSTSSPYGRYSPLSYKSSSPAYSLSKRSVKTATPHSLKSYHGIKHGTKSFSLERESPRTTKDKQISRHSSLPYYSSYSKDRDRVSSPSGHISSYSSSSYRDRERSTPSPDYSKRYDCGSSRSSSTNSSRDSSASSRKSSTSSQGKDRVVYVGGHPGHTSSQDSAARDISLITHQITRTFQGDSRRGSDPSAKETTSPFLRTYSLRGSGYPSRYIQRQSLERKSSLPTHVSLRQQQKNVELERKSPQPETLQEERSRRGNWLKTRKKSPDSEKGSSVSRMSSKQRSDSSSPGLSKGRFSISSKLSSSNESTAEGSTLKKRFSVPSKYFSSKEVVGKDSSREGSSEMLDSSELGKVKKKVSLPGRFSFRKRSASSDCTMGGKSESAPTSPESYFNEKSLLVKAASFDSESDRTISAMIGRLKFWDKKEKGDDGHSRLQSPDEIRKRSESSPAQVRAELIPPRPPLPPVSTENLSLEDKLRSAKSSVALLEGPEPISMDASKVPLRTVSLDSGQDVYIHSRKESAEEHALKYLKKAQSWTKVEIVSKRVDKEVAQLVKTAESVEDSLREQRRARYRKTSGEKDRIGFSKSMDATVNYNTEPAESVINQCKEESVIVDQREEEKERDTSSDKDVSEKLREKRKRRRLQREQFFASMSPPEEKIIPNQQSIDSVDGPTKQSDVSQKDLVGNGYLPCDKNESQKGIAETSVLKLKVSQETTKSLLSKPHGNVESSEAPSRCPLPTDILSRYISEDDTSKTILHPERKKDDRPHSICGGSLSPDEMKKFEDINFSLARQVSFEEVSTLRPKKKWLTSLSELESEQHETEEIGKSLDPDLPLKAVVQASEVEKFVVVKSKEVPGDHKKAVRKESSGTEDIVDTNLKTLFRKKKHSVPSVEKEEKEKEKKKEKEREKEKAKEREREKKERGKVEKERKEREKQREKDEERERKEREKQRHREDEKERKGKGKERLKEEEKEKHKEKEREETERKEKEKRHRKAVRGQRHKEKERKELEKKGKKDEKHKENEKQEEDENGTEKEKEEIEKKEHKNQMKKVQPEEIEKKEEDGESELPKAGAVSALRSVFVKKEPAKPAIRHLRKNRPNTLAVGIAPEILKAAREQVAREEKFRNRGVVQDDIYVHQTGTESEEEQVMSNEVVKPVVVVQQSLEINNEEEEKKTKQKESKRVHKTKRGRKISSTLRPFGMMKTKSESNLNERFDLMQVNIAYDDEKNEEEKKPEEKNVIELTAVSTIIVPPVISQLISDRVGKRPEEPNQNQSDFSEGLESFFGESKLKVPDEASPKFEITSEDLDAISLQTTGQLKPVGEDKLHLKPKRKHASKANPIKSLRQRTDIRTETEVPRTPRIEKKPVTSDHPVIRRKKKKYRDPDNLWRRHTLDLAASAIAGLASTEDFTKVLLRKTGGPEKAKEQDSYRGTKPTMLLHIKGRRNIQTRLAEPCQKSFNSGDCFVLVTKEELFAWVGKEANAIERAKVTEIASRIFTKRELDCKARDITFIEEKNKDVENIPAVKRFWKVLNGDPDAEIRAANAIPKDEDYEKGVTRTNMVYKVHWTEPPSLMPIESACGYLPQISVLDTKEVLIFDFGSELYVWNGQQSLSGQRKTAFALGRQLFESPFKPLGIYDPLYPYGKGSEVISDNKTSVGRPAWAMLARLHEKAETILFREKFLDWPDPTKIIKMKGHPSSGEIIVKPFLKVELKPCDPKIMTSLQEQFKGQMLEGVNVGRGMGVPTIWTGEYYKEGNLCNTVGLTVWHINEYRHYELPQANMGHFHSGEGYVIRWAYFVMTDRIAIDRKSRCRSTVTGRVRTAYFFWQGNDCTVNEKGAAAVMAVELDEERGPQIRVTQGKEPPCFLNLFKSGMIIHFGNVSKCWFDKEKRDHMSGTMERLSDASTVRLYVVRHEQPGEGCLVQVRASGNSLRSRGCFVLLLCLEGKMFVWHGAKSMEETRKVAMAAAKHIQAKKPMECNVENVSAVTIKELQEGQEPDEFFKVLGGKKYYCSLVNDPSAHHFTSRLFELSSSTGKFMSSEIICPSRMDSKLCPFAYLQEDLYTAKQPSLFLLDNHFEVYIWEGWIPEDDIDSLTGTGKQRWDNDRKLAMETAVKYAEDVGKRVSHRVFVVYAGLEPMTFKVALPYWNDNHFVISIQKQTGKQAGAKQPVHELLQTFTKDSYTLEELQQTPPPQGVDPSKLETYLSISDFQEVFKMTQEEFTKLPGWKQQNMKKAASLF